MIDIHTYLHTHIHIHTHSHTQVSEYGIHDLVSGPQHIGCVYAVGVDSLYVVNTRD
jgi:hydrogenase/urease accessory protein HupE